MSRETPSRPEKPSSIVQNVLDRVTISRLEKDGWVCHCPAHGDESASLKIAERQDGGALLTCRAGCTLEMIVSALQLEIRDLFPKGPSEGGTGRSQGHGRPTFGKVKAIYSYTTEQGVLLYQALRDENKNFRLRRPTNAEPPAELWSYDLAGVERVLYRLPEVAAAKHYRHRIYFVEGEKDADNVAMLGLTATTIAQGASAPWFEQFTAQLAGAPEIVILPDNDDPGRKAGDKVRDAIIDQVGCVRILALPNLEPKGDVSDWIAAGGTREKLEALADKAPICPAPSRRFTSVAIDLATFLEREYPKPKALLGAGVMCAGDLVFLYGRPGLGKTYLISQYAITGAEGEGFVGLAGPEGPLRIGILELECHASFWQDRFRALLPNGRANGCGSRIQVIARPDLKGAVDLRADDWKALQRWCKESELDLVMIDALSRAHSADENKAVEFGPVLQRLDDIRFETGTAIVCVHHEPKISDERDDMDCLRGSSRMQSDSNALIRLVRVGDTGSKLFNLRFPKVNNGPEPAPIWLARGNAGFVVTEAPAAKAEVSSNKVREALFAAGAKGLTWAELVEQTGLSKGTVSKHMALLPVVAEGEPYTVTDKRNRSKVCRRLVLRVSEFPEAGETGRSDEAATRSREIDPND